MIKLAAHLFGILARPTVGGNGRRQSDNWKIEEIILNQKKNFIQFSIFATFKFNRILRISNPINRRSDFCLKFNNCQPFFFFKKKLNLLIQFKEFFLLLLLWRTKHSTGFSGSRGDSRWLLFPLGPAEAFRVRRQLTDRSALAFGSQAGTCRSYFFILGIFRRFIRFIDKKL